MFFKKTKEQLIQKSENITSILTFKLDEANRNLIKVSDVASTLLALLMMNMLVLTVAVIFLIF